MTQHKLNRPCGLSQSLRRHLGLSAGTSQARIRRQWRSGGNTIRAEHSYRHQDKLRGAALKSSPTLSLRVCCESCVDGMAPRPASTASSLLLRSGNVSNDLARYWHSPTLRFQLHGCTAGPCKRVREVWLVTYQEVTSGLCEGQTLSLPNPHFGTIVALGLL